MTTQDSSNGLPANFSLTLYRGDSYSRKFKLWSDKDKTKPVDLTGVTAKSEIKDQPDGKVVVEMDCSVELPNIVNVKLEAENSKKLPLPTGSWDLELTYLNGDVRTIVFGPVNSTADITNSSVVILVPSMLRVSRTR